MNPCRQIYYKCFWHCSLGLMLIISACTPLKNLDPIPQGATSSQVLIQTEPTPADIYLNDQYLGRSPLRTDLWYFDHNMVNIKAEPIYPRGQHTQNIYLRFPPIPDKITIFMNHHPKERDVLAAEAPPPDPLLTDVKIPAPVFIEPVKPDTVIIENKVIETHTIPTPSIFFDFDSYDLHETEIPKLHQIAGLLQNNPEYRIAVHGYSDEIGAADYNLILSLLRAETVQSFLIDQGIAEARMDVYGHGQRSTINLEGVELEYQQNRTVDFTVILPGNGHSPTMPDTTPVQQDQIEEPVIEPKSEYTEPDSPIIPEPVVPDSTQPIPEPPDQN